MSPLTGSARVFVAWATLALGGCAAMRNEPPPEVAPQPPEVTAAEVVAEGRISAEEAAEEAQHVTDGQAVAPTGVATPETGAPRGPPGNGNGQSDGASVRTAVQTIAGRAAYGQRSRPTERSTADIRTQQAAAPPPLDFNQRLDYAHDKVYVWAQGVVEATDRRFIEKDETPRPVPAAPFRLGLVGEAIQRNEGPKFALDSEFDIALRLPNLERRLRVFVTSGNLDEAPRNERETEGLRAGLRYELLRYLNFDIGVRVAVPPVLFTSVKWTREFELGSWDFYPFAKIFAETEQSVGYAAALTFDRWVGRNLFRTSTYAKWRADRDRTEWSQTLIYARANELLVPDRNGSYPRANDIGRGWGLRLLAGGETAHSVDHYETGIFYRRPTTNRWLYWSVEPLVRWDREYGWSPDPGIRIGIEALFWDLARPARQTGGLTLRRGEPAVR